MTEWQSHLLNSQKCQRSTYTSALRGYFNTRWLTNWLHWRCGNVGNQKSTFVLGNKMRSAEANDNTTKHNSPTLKTKSMNLNYPKLSLPISTETPIPKQTILDCNPYCPTASRSNIHQPRPNETETQIITIFCSCRFPPFSGPNLSFFADCSSTPSLQSCSPHAHI